MKDSKIEWTDHTFNPWWGCTKVSPGCANCYAESLSKRWGKKLWGKDVLRERRSESYWREPLKWNKAAALELSVYQKGCETFSWWPEKHQKPQRPRVFCASMADWLDDEVPIEWLADFLQLIHDTPNLDWLLLTKRPGNFAKRLYGGAEEGGAFEVVRQRDGSGCLNSPVCNLLCFIGDWANKSFPDNVWVGTSVENQEMADKRIPELLKIPAKVRFLSCEPLIKKIDLLQSFTENCDVADLEAQGYPIDLTFEYKEVWESRFAEQIHWVICGGESGHHARPMHPDWARSLRDQCQAAEVPFFFKQWGQYKPISPIYHDDGKDEDKIGEANDKKCFRLAPDGTIWGDEYQPPCGTWIIEKSSKENSGCLLDGVEHREFPAHTLLLEESK